MTEDEKRIKEKSITEMRYLALRMDIVHSKLSNHLLKCADEIEKELHSYRPSLVKGAAC